MKDAASFRIDFEPGGETVTANNAVSVLDAARKAGIDIPTACGGNGKCATCRVKIVSGPVSQLTADERELLSEAELAKGYRLACCTRPLGDLVVRLPKMPAAGAHRLQVEGGDRLWPVDPMVTCHDTAVPPPGLHDPRPDLERVVQAVEADGYPGGLTADTVVVGQLSGQLRTHQWHVGAMIRGNELIGCCAAGQHPLGMAVDLGTTKIAAHLLDLTTGKELAADGMLNPQTRHGDDIMSRLQFAVKNDGGDELARLVCTALNALLHTLTQKAQVDCRQVADICLVGNTAITHLLLKLPVRQLAVAPYVAATGAAVNIHARDLGLDTAPGAKVHILPGIGGFVGADHVAMMMGADIDLQDQVSIGIDIGTNTEIVLRDPGASHLYALSCPSGPAFEGAHVVGGMRAASGAIEAVNLALPDIQLTTIDNEKPVGLCGSGIVDVMAELYRHGMINDRGRFQSDHPGVRQGARGYEFLLSPARDNGTEEDIVFTQGDVEEIQLAKGAIRAGIEILLDERHMPPEAVSQVFVAGAFGAFLNIPNAIAIGLLSDFPNAGYHQVGNMAAAGAIMALLSAQVRQRAVEIAKKTKYVELTGHPKFNRQFALGMLFPK